MSRSFLPTKQKFNANIVYAQSAEILNLFIIDLLLTLTVQSNYLTINLVYKTCIINLLNSIWKAYEHIRLPTKYMNLIIVHDHMPAAGLNTWSYTIAYELHIAVRNLYENQTQMWHNHLTSIRIDTFCRTNMFERFLDIGIVWKKYKYRYIFW